MTVHINNLVPSDLNLSFQIGPVEVQGRLLALLSVFRNEGYFYETYIFARNLNILPQNDKFFSPFSLES